MQYDPELGQQVHEHLKKLGVETPMAKKFDPHKDKIAERVGDILFEGLGLDPNDDSLRDTPQRVAKMYCEELFGGLDYNKFPKCTCVENKMGYDEVVLEKDIIIRSMCEHHLMPIYGKAQIAYICDKKVLGISKFNRVAEFFAARPQVQERLTVQISQALQFILDSNDVMVVIEADHFCSKLRGVKDACSSTVTSKMTGRFRTELSLREEALMLSRRN